MTELYLLSPLIVFATPAQQKAIQKHAETNGWKIYVKIDYDRLK